ncbi:MULTISPECIES: DUF1453 domain-containing protein [unclassified Streptomyces]|uniref:DUF1453 domain-containing protein n=1 Tax=unclassified Streptomyces TaxID=2593676 RepID=UPI002E2D0464|nr:DUF1453 domain-containing protein [Streptomyces sp. NBC_01423]WSX93733.1 DUF1453 family protein [Streptomyces sp. NBC_00891]WSY08210.1 DUF1453 family protein [Streptomyces sp. NBC_00890]WSZ09834.1 DUF1453 family protein [Streptomyces sp. NBC_00869]WSZ22665.1 DUF1453 family protein [Streptomyces sp. NBC_00870]
MSGLVNALVIVAVIALVVVRQCSAQRISDNRRRWVLPAVLLVMAVREPGLIDQHHRTASATVLCAELLVGVVTGAGWAWTSRVWRAEDGSVWSKGTKATAMVWAGGLGLRAALYGIAVALGVHQGSPALMAALGATLLVREGLLAQRATAIPAPYGGAPAGVPVRQERKDHV